MNLLTVVMVSLAVSVSRFGLHSVRQSGNPDTARGYFSLSVFVAIVCVLALAAAVIQAIRDSGPGKDTRLVLAQAAWAGALAGLTWVSVSTCRELRRYRRKTTT